MNSLVTLCVKGLQALFRDQHKVSNTESTVFRIWEGRWENFWCIVFWTSSHWQKDPTNLGLLSIHSSSIVLLSVQKLSWNWSISPFACPSCNLSRSFLGISQLETQHSVMGPSGVVLYRVKFFGENFLWAKITKNGMLGQLGH